jgi:hypothetical protein
MSLGNAFTPCNTSYFIAYNTTAVQSVSVAAPTGDKLLFTNAGNTGCFVSMSANTTTPAVNTTGAIAGNNTGTLGGFTNTTYTTEFYLPGGGSLLLTAPWAGFSASNVNTNMYNYAGGVSAIGGAGTNTGGSFLTIIPGWGDQH